MSKCLGYQQTGTRVFTVQSSVFGSTLTCRKLQKKSEDETRRGPKWAKKSSASLFLTMSGERHGSLVQIPQKAMIGRPRALSARPIHAVNQVRE